MNIEIMFNIFCFGAERSSNYYHVQWCVGNKIRLHCLVNYSINFQYPRSWCPYDWISFNLFIVKPKRAFTRVFSTVEFLCHTIVWHLWNSSVIKSVSYPHFGLKSSLWVWFRIDPFNIVFLPIFWIRLCQVSINKSNYEICILGIDSNIKLIYTICWTVSQVHVSSRPSRTLCLSCILANGLTILIQIEAWFSIYFKAKSKQTRERNWHLGLIIISVVVKPCWTSPEVSRLCCKPSITNGRLVKSLFESFQLSFAKGTWYSCLYNSKQSYTK